MPTLLLYDHPSSICSQMARLALVEKGLAFERRTVDIMVTDERARLETNVRFQALLRDPTAIESHVDAARRLVERFDAALESQPFIAASAYSLAVCFATAALARFTIPGFARSWEGTRVADHQARMKARPSYGAARVIDTGTESEP